MILKVSWLCFNTILIRKASTNSTDSCKLDQSIGSFFFRFFTKFLWREISRVKDRVTPSSTHFTPHSHLPIDDTKTEPNMPAGRPRKKSFVMITGERSNWFAKRAAEPNPVPAEPDKAEEPDQQHYDHFVVYPSNCHVVIILRRWGGVPLA